MTGGVFAHDVAARAARVTDAIEDGELDFAARLAEDLERDARAIVDEPLEERAA